MPDTSRHIFEQELARGSALSMIGLVDALIASAYEADASDIHVDVDVQGLRIRFRTDGIMYDAYRLPKELLSGMVTRIKILAHLRTDEHQAAQDGRFRVDHHATQEALDVRVSIVPTYHGESAVLRILAQQADRFTIESLGFSPQNKERVMRALRNPYGMILATGPTGSGKTTTLYAMLKALNTSEASIVTIEDPIEYAVPNIKQIPVNHQTGLTFATGLRSILRQDPDTIMVGEIRDQETAGLAVNTALTGHLLLSTLHTNDSATTIARLLDLGIEPYLVASTVTISIAQRLVRKVCSECTQNHSMTREERTSLAAVLDISMLTDDIRFSAGAGCTACNNTGFRGRVAIHEVLVVDDAVRQAILTKASIERIKELSVAQGMTTMIHDGFIKAAVGITAITEVLRIIHE